MKIQCLENNFIKIENKYNSITLEINDIEKIFISCKHYFFLKFYYLNIFTNNKKYCLHFKRREKEIIKKEVYNIKVLIN